MLKKLALAAGTVWLTMALLERWRARTALALGADRAIHVEGDGLARADASVVAAACKALSNALFDCHEAQVRVWLTLCV